MTTHSIAQPFTWALLLAGFLLAFVSAMVPHYDAGHRLLVSVLLTGLLPYLIYALNLPYLRGWRLAFPLLLIVAVHAATVAYERFIDYHGYNDGSVFYVPLALSLVALVVLILALRAHQPGREP